MSRKKEGVELRKTDGERGGRKTDLEVPSSVFISRTWTLSRIMFARQRRAPNATLNAHNWYFQLRGGTI